MKTGKEWLRMSKTASTEYLFSSARVRALETRLLGNARLAQLTDVRTLDELSAALGQEAPSENTRLKNAFDSVAAMIPFIWKYFPRI